MERHRPENHSMGAYRIADLHKLSGIVPAGLLNRVAAVGGIPDRGPGSYSVPKAIKIAEIAEDQKNREKQNAFPQTKEQRRQWNINNRMIPRF